MKRRTIDIILYRTYAELKSEARRTYIGILWWLFEPVLFMLIFYFVFAVLFQRGTENFVAFLLIGLTLWQWFQSTVMQCSGSITANRGIIQQIYIPKFVFPTVVVLANTVKFAVVLVVLTLFLYGYGISPTAHWIYSLPVLGTALLLIVGCSLVVAAVTPLLPDLRILLENGLRGLFFLSGIFYDINALPEPYVDWMKWNPMATIINDMRAALMDQHDLHWARLAVIAASSVALILAGLIVLNRNESLYAKKTL